MTSGGEPSAAPTGTSAAAARRRGGTVLRQTQMRSTAKLHPLWQIPQTGQNVNLAQSDGSRICPKLQSSLIRGFLGSEQLLAEQQRLPEPLVFLLLLPAGECQLGYPGFFKTRAGAFARNLNSSSANETSPVLKSLGGSSGNCALNLWRCQRPAKCQFCEDQGEEACQGPSQPHNRQRSEAGVERPHLSPNQEGRDLPLHAHRLPNSGCEWLWSPRHHRASHSSQLRPRFPGERTQSHVHAREDHTAPRTPITL
ncbi:unnamed protein product [Pleuronectes platessa]|uniref:Uncharacterized protein n=1 Tax=Pleuronectes platessa TaxID=8262 RepID=A0A9N7TNV9_PLEPL|nr:unnamed protein product [Pleuronectes platessa]